MRTFSTAAVACIASCMTPSKRGNSICRFSTNSRLCLPSAEREDRLSSSVLWLSPSRSGTRILGCWQRGGAHAHFSSIRERDQQHHLRLGERRCSLGETMEEWKHRRHLADERRHQTKLQRHQYSNPLARTDHQRVQNSLLDDLPASLGVGCASPRW